jgi:hypothetical protein
MRARFIDRKCWTPSPLRVGPRSPINSGPYLSNFVLQAPNPSDQGFLAVRIQFITARRNWSMSEQEGDVRSLFIMFLWPEDHRRSQSLLTRVIWTTPLLPVFHCRFSLMYVCKTGSSRHLDHVGRNQVVFGALHLEFELSLHRPWCPSGYVQPGRDEEGGDSPEPSDLGWTIEIRTKITLHFIEIHVVGRQMDGRRLMRVCGPCESTPWTRSTAPWTYSTGFLIEK